MGSIPGGFFVPFDRAQPWGLWSTGASVGQAVAVLGPLGAGFGSADPDSQAIYIVDLPAPTKAQLEDYVSSQK